MKINDIITEKLEDLPINDAGEVTGKEGKFASPHPFIGDRVAVFHGPNSKKWSPEMVKLARKLEKNGANRQSIWKRTGVFRNSNGDWRMEISDYNMAVKKVPQRNEILTLDQVIDHPELFKAYPLLKNMPVKGYDIRDDGTTLGYYDPSVHHLAMRTPDGSQDGGDLTLAKQRWRRTMAHEIQHAIQAIEKPLSQKFKGDNDRIKADLKKAGVDVTSHQVYKAWWKEIDARLVSDRLKNKPEFNKEFSPTNVDTKWWQVDNSPNPPPGKVIAKTPSKYPTAAVDSLILANPFVNNDMEPFQNDPTYNKGNSQGAKDQSNDGYFSSPYRNTLGGASNKTGTDYEKLTPVKQPPVKVATKPAPQGAK